MRMYITFSAKLLYSSCKHVLSFRVENTTIPDQMALSTVFFLKRIHLGSAEQIFWIIFCFIGGAQIQAGGFRGTQTRPGKMFEIILSFLMLSRESNSNIH